MAATPVTTTGYTTNTPKHYLMDAGAVYKNLTFNPTGGTESTGGWEGEKLGATAGGNELKIENKYRQIEIDGVFTKAMGQSVLESSEAKLKIRVKEVTAEIIRMAINGTSVKGDGKDAPSDYDVIGGKGILETSDYIKNVGLVARLSGSKQPVIVILDNVICTSGLEFKTEDNKEAVIEMELEATANETQITDRTLPARIYFPPVPEA